MEFFPDMYWRGIPVELMTGWVAEADEPTLLLLLKQNSGETLTPEVQRQRRQLLDDHGWKYDGTICTMYLKCRLDDPNLELVPGEPPESLYR